VHHFPSFPGAVLSTSSCKFFSFFSPRWLHSNRYIRSLLKGARPEQLPDKVPAGSDSHHNPKFSASLSLPLLLTTVGAITPGVAGAPPYPALPTLMLLLLPLFSIYIR
jgi:hypothetical protein